MVERCADRVAIEWRIKSQAWWSRSTNFHQPSLTSERGGLCNQLSILIQMERYEKSIISNTTWYRCEWNWRPMWVIRMRSTARFKSRPFIIHTVASNEKRLITTLRLKETHVMYKIIFHCKLVLEILIGGYMFIYLYMCYKSSYDRKKNKRYV